MRSNGRAGDGRRTTGSGWKTQAVVARPQPAEVVALPCEKVQDDAKRRILRYHITLLVFLRSSDTFWKYFCREKTPGEGEMAGDVFVKLPGPCGHIRRFLQLSQSDFINFRLQSLLFIRKLVFSQFF